MGTVDHLPGVIIPSREDTNEGTRLGISELMIASFDGDTDTVHQLLTADRTRLAARNQQGATALHYAVSSKQRKVVDTFLAHGVDLDALDGDGYNILHRSVQSGQLDKVTTCIELGLCMDYRSATGDTALILAVKGNCLHIVKYLVDVGCDISTLNSEGLSAVQYAFLNDQIEMHCFLERKNNANQFVATEVGRKLAAATKDGDIASILALIENFSQAIVDFAEPVHNITAMVVACQNRQLVAAQVLRQNGASIHIRLNSGGTALSLAAKSGCMEIVEWLLSEGALSNSRNSNHETALHHSVREGHLDVVKKLVECSGALLNVKSFKESSPLYIAVVRDHGEILKYLLEQGACVDRVSEGGLTALGIAAGRGQLQCMRDLLHHGAHIDKPQTQGCSPLMLAAMLNQYESVQLLVQHGADVYFSNPDGDTAITLAYFRNNMEILSYLTDLRPQNAELRMQSISEEKPNPSGSQPEHQDLRDKLFSMCETGCELQELGQFTDSSVDTNVQRGAGITPLITAVIHHNNRAVNWLVQNKARVDLADSSGMTPLMHAAKLGFTDVVNILLAHDADLSNVDVTGQNAVMFAESSGQMEVVHTLKTHERMAKIKNLFNAVKQSDYDRCVELVKTGTDVNAIDPSGKTLIYFCITSSSPLAAKIARLLCSAGFDSEMRDGGGRRPLELCVVWGHAEVAEVLLASGASLDRHLPHILLDACLLPNTQMLRVLITYANQEAPWNRQHNWNMVIKYALANGAYDLVSALVGGNHVCQEYVKLSHCLYESLEVHYSNVHSTKYAHQILSYCSQCLSSLGITSAWLESKACRKQLLKVMLEMGDYEAAKVVSPGNPAVVVMYPSESESSWSGHSTHQDFQIEIYKENIAVLWQETHDLMYEALKQRMDRFTCGDIIGLSRSGTGTAIYVHTSSIVPDEVTQCISKEIAALPHSETLTLQVVNQSHQSYSLSRIRHMKDQCYSIPSKTPCIPPKVYPKLYIAQDDIWDTSKEFSHHLLGFCIQDTSNAIWLITAASNMDMLQSPHHHQPVLCFHLCDSIQKTVELDNSICYFALVLDKSASVDIAATRVHTNTKELCTPKKIYCGSRDAMLNRIVIKTGHCGETTDGIIIDVDVSFRDQKRHFYHGAFVVAALDPASALTDPGDCGSLVTDKESGLVFGYIVAGQRNYTCPVQRVTYDKIAFCVELYKGLQHLNNTWGLQIGKFQQL